MTARLRGYQADVEKFKRDLQAAAAGLRVLLRVLNRFMLGLEAPQPPFELYRYRPVLHVMLRAAEIPYLWLRARRGSGPRLVLPE